MNYTPQVFFTSDTHFGHKLCAELRGFKDTDSHDLHLIREWNKRVCHADRVYHLGDFALCSPGEARRIAKMLNGQIYLIRGNHDSAVGRIHKQSDSPFVWLRDVEYITVQHDGERRKIFLSHYAHRVWRSSHHGSWHLYGHSHGSLPGQGKSLDVGVDNWDLGPVSFSRLLRVLDSVEVSVVDHHEQTPPSETDNNEGE